MDKIQTLIKANIYKEIYDNLKINFLNLIPIKLSNDYHLVITLNNKFLN